MGKAENNGRSRVHGTMGKMLPHGAGASWQVQAGHGGEEPVMWHALQTVSPQMSAAALTPHAAKIPHVMHQFRKLDR